MITALGFHPREFDRTRDLLLWIRDLKTIASTPVTPHSLLLVAAYGTDNNLITELSTIARQYFTKVVAIKQNMQNEDPWPKCCNAMFRTANEGLRVHFPGQPFLWLESDIAPMEPGWLERIEAEYSRAGKPYMGTVYPLPKPHINGVMVYPANIRQHNPATLTANDIPWDVIAADTTLSKAHVTPLIQRSIANPAKNEPHTFPNIQAVTTIVRPGVLIFHGCKDGTLIKRLRERYGLYPDAAPADAPKPLPTPAPSPVARIARRVANKLTGTPVYYHSGNLGDLIYALYAIKLHLGDAGRGDLIIGPDLAGAAPCSNPISRPQFDLLAPLLRAQPYIRNLEWRAAHPGKDATHDLNRFRDLWQNPPTRAQTGINTLCQMHCHLLGVADLFRPDEAWLTVPDALFTDRLVIHRSPRHQATDKLFPWPEIIQKYASKLLFIGLPEEHRAFAKAFGHQPAFYQCRDFLDMAQVIAGGCAFLGNQSFPCSIALGLGQKVFQEAWPPSPDCLFNRPTFMTQI